MPTDDGDPASVPRFAEVRGKTRVLVEGGTAVSSVPVSRAKGHHGAHVGEAIGDSRSALLAGHLNLLDGKLRNPLQPLDQEVSESPLCPDARVPHT
jgi:hypothetical protein